MGFYETKKNEVGQVFSLSFEEKRRLLCQSNQNTQFDFLDPSSNARVECTAIKPTTSDIIKHLEKIKSSVFCQCRERCERSVQLWTSFERRCRLITTNRSKSTYLWFDAFHFVPNSFLSQAGFAKGVEWNCPQRVSDWNPLWLAISIVWQRQGGSMTKMRRRGSSWMAREAAAKSSAVHAWMHMRLRLQFPKGLKSVSIEYRFFNLRDPESCSKCPCHLDPMFLVGNLFI